MKVYTGTSGFSYKPWKGAFYPEGLPDRDMLAYYSTRLTTVEINNTFYRMPKPELLAGWASKVPEDFRFVIKAPKTITHRARLRESSEALRHLWKALDELGEKLGAVLFQLPPTLRLDLELLERFLEALPDAGCAAFEFRHASWIEPEVQELLGARGAVVCVADMEQGIAVPLESDAPWGYLRLRREAYTDEELAGWAERLSRTRWKRAFVFFKHEDAGAAPQMALRMAQALGAGA